MSEPAIEPATPPEPAAPAAEAPPAEPAAPDTTPQQPTPQQPQLDPNDPAVQQAVAQYMDGLLAEATQYQQQQQQTPQAAPQPPDPFSENYAQELQAFLEHRDQQMLSQIQQTLGSVLPVVESVQLERGNAAIQETLSGLRGEVEGFDPDKHGKLAETFAQGLLPQVTAQYGATPQAAQVALRQGAEMVRDMVKAERADAVKEYVESLQRPNGPGAVEPRAGGAAIDAPDPSRMTYEQIALRSYDSIPG